MAADRPIVLIGMMFSGKTTVGRRVAARLVCPFVDLDEMIEQETERSVADWFELGEPAFRRVESEILQSLLDREGLSVIATGGGAVLDAENRRRCRERGFVVYLEATAEELAARVVGPSGRPLIDAAPSPAADLDRILGQRRDIYRQTQHLSLPAGRLGIDELTEAIVRAHGTRTKH